MDTCVKSYGNFEVVRSPSEITTFTHTCARVRSDCNFGRTLLCVSSFLILHVLYNRTSLVKGAFTSPIALFLHLLSMCLLPNLSITFSHALVSLSGLKRFSFHSLQAFNRARFIIAFCVFVYLY